MDLGVADLKAQTSDHVVELFIVPVGVNGLILQYFYQTLRCFLRRRRQIFLPRIKAHALEIVRKLIGHLAVILTIIVTAHQILIKCNRSVQRYRQVFRRIRRYLDDVLIPQIRICLVYARLQLATRHRNLNLKHDGMCIRN